MENYKDLYFFLFNRITDMIQELQLLQQQAEEAFMSGYGNDPQSASHMHQALLDAADPASHISSSMDYQTHARTMSELPEFSASVSDTILTKTQTVAGTSRSPLLFERPNKPPFPAPSISPEFVHRPAVNDTPGNFS